MDVGTVGTGESTVKRKVLLRGKHIISDVGSNKLSFYVNEKMLSSPSLRISQEKIVLTNIGIYFMIIL